MSWLFRKFSSIMEWSLLGVIFLLINEDASLTGAFAISGNSFKEKVFDSHEMKWIPNEVDNDAVDAQSDINSTNKTDSSLEDDDDDEDQMSWDFDITNVFQNLLPSFGSNQAPLSTNSGNTGSPQYEQNNMSTLLSKLLESVIIDRNSIFRLQFYNTEFTRNASSDNSNDSSIVPNAVFGSPLCWGICFTSQVYSQNGSVRILSDKRFSLFPPKASSTTTENSVDHFQPIEGNIPSGTTTDGDNNSSTITSGSGILSWVPEWIYNSTGSLSIPRLPSVSSIPLQYTLIPSIGVPSFVG